jgi:hypothetical protein
LTQSNRKLVGVILTLIVLVAYVGLATAIYIAFLTGLPPWLLLIYFAVAGLGWAVPVSFIIRWMARPDSA